MEGIMKRQVSGLALVVLAALPLMSQMAASHKSIFEQEAPKLQVTGRPVARVNGAVLTDRDLLREMFTIFPYARQHNGTFPKAMESEIRNGAMKMIVFEELVYQEALRRRMTIPATRLDKAERDFRNQFHSPEQYQEFLKNETNGSQRGLRDKIRRVLLIESLINQEVTSKSAVTLAQANAYYTNNPDKFRQPESFAIQTISVMPPEKATPQQMKEARKRAEDALRQAKATKDYESFGLLAEKISEDDYRVMMGDHKTVEAGKLPAEIAEAVRKMQPGQVSDILQVEQVYTIVRLNGHTPEGMQKFVDVKDTLRQRMRQNKAEELRAGLNQRLRKNAKVEEL
jgi:peptidyl-prolyl cis-trans isomerase SurA